MTRRVQLKKTGKEIGERIDFLREVTAALLDEVKALTSLKNIKLETGTNFEEEVKNFEIYLIKRALEITSGSQIQAAQLLKIKYTTLNSKIKRYGIRSGDLYKNRFLMNPNFVETYNNLGVALRDAGKKKEAHRLFLKAVQLRPGWNYAVFNLAVSFIEKGNREAAYRQLAILDKIDAQLAAKLKENLWRKFVTTASS